MGVVPEGLAAADLIGSGRPALVAALQNATGDGLVGISFNPPNMSNPVTFDSGGFWASSVAIADLNGDGKLDIAVSNYGCSGNCGPTTVGVLLGRGDGTFQPVKTYKLGTSLATGVAIGDLNHDGKPDLVVAAFGRIVVLLGKGDGTFGAAVSFPVLDFGFNSLALADMNGDGNLDVVACGDQSVVVFLGNGKGRLGTAQEYYSGVSSGGIANSVAVADLNGDGKPDVAVANYPDSKAGILLNQGNGTLLPVVTYDLGAQDGWAVALSDVTGDLKPDLVVAGAFGTASLLVNNGDGTFQAPIVYTLAHSANAIIMADLNNDRRPDLTISDGGFYAWTVLHTSTIPLLNTTTTETSSKNPTVVGQTIKLTATVASSQGNPQDGELVTFKDGANVLGTAALRAGVASLNVSTLAVGHHYLSAHYPGNSDFLRPSASQAFEQVVTKSQ
jgi:hypothetical protein